MEKLPKANPLAHNEGDGYAIPNGDGISSDSRPGI